MTDEVAAEMPKYRCHKEVWALKIAAIKEVREIGGIMIPRFHAVITPVENGYAPFEVSVEFMEKHKPYVGGYYVVYEDGYKSFSPAAAFDSGYTRIP